MPNDTIKEVKGFENKFQEEGEVIGFTSINVYEACTNSACYHKKLVNKECPTCHRQYSSETENVSQRSAVCNIMVDTGKETPEEITLFDTHIKELLQTQQIPESNEDFELKVNELPPSRVSFTPSPKKDKTVCSFMLIKKKLFSS